MSHSGGGKDHWAKREEYPVVYIVNTRYRQGCDAAVGPGVFLDTHKRKTGEVIVATTFKLANQKGSSAVIAATRVN